MKFIFYRLFKNGKLSKSPICEIEAASEKDAWKIFGDREYYLSYSDTTRFVIR
jgi:hypothetical protein